MNFVKDFKSRASTYLVACSAYMLSHKGTLNSISEHIDFILQDSASSGFPETTIRLYTEVNSLESGINLVKNYIMNNFDNVHIKHLKDVPTDQMEEIISFANAINSGLTYMQSNEQKRQEFQENFPVSETD